jgi:hypothetical protein
LTTLYSEPHIQQGVVKCFLDNLDDLLDDSLSLEQVEGFGVIADGMSLESRRAAQEAYLLEKETKDRLLNPSRRTPAPRQTPLPSLPVPSRDIHRTGLSRKQTPSPPISSDKLLPTGSSSGPVQEEELSDAPHVADEGGTTPIERNTAEPVAGPKPPPENFPPTENTASCEPPPPHVSNPYPFQIILNSPPPVPLQPNANKALLVPGSQLVPAVTPTVPAELATTFPKPRKI